MTEPTLMLIDGHYFLHRVMHLDTFTMMRTREGNRLTGGVYGMISSIKNALERFPTVRRCIIAWDVERSHRRLKILPEYKANREAKTELEAKEQEEYYKQFRDQLEALQENVPHLGIRQALLDGTEGDDVIGWISQKIAYDTPKVIASEDMDILQLVNEHTSVYQPFKEQVVTLENFRDKTGVRKELFLVYKALSGDTSDNIPGIPQVGKTTVGKIIEKANAAYDEGRPAVTAGPCKEWWELLEYVCEGLQATDTKSRSRYQKVLANLPTVDRNLELIDLSEESLDAGQTSVLTCLVTGGEARFNEQRVLKFFGEMEFASFLQGFSQTTQPFRVLV